MSHPLPAFVDLSTGEHVYATPTDDQILALWRHASPRDVNSLPRVGAGIPWTSFKAEVAALLVALTHRTEPYGPYSQAERSATVEYLERQTGSTLETNWPFFRYPTAATVQAEAVRMVPQETDRYFMEVRSQQGRVPPLKTCQQQMQNLVRLAKEKVEEGRFSLLQIFRMMKFMTGHWPSPLGPGPLLSKLQQTEENVRPPSEELEQYSLSRRMQRLHRIDGARFARRAVREAEEMQGRKW
ncbi:hypothetical protein JCM8547_009183 [Rhodosporidiobolus lusitaniae]